MSKLRIGIVDDDRITGDLLAAVCTREFGAEVVLKETTGVRGLAEIVRLRPDLVILDLCLPDLDGLDIARKVRADLPLCRVVALSALRDPVTLTRVRALRLHGFVDKREQSLDMLKHALAEVILGKGYFAPIMAATLEEMRQSGRAYHLVLSEREQRILVLLGNARTDAEIAEMTDLTPATVQSRRRDIMRKLNIHSTPKLIQYANEMGFARLGKYFVK